jgi:hypothetical protein
MKKVIFTLSTVIICLTSIAQDSVQVKYANSITASDLSKQLHVIASDDYEGRETGKKGQKMAAEYIANYFKENNIPGGNAGDYFQSFPLKIQKPVGVTLFVNSKKFEFLEDFYYYRGFNDTNITADQIVFAGYGIEDSLYNDYDGLEVKGKVVMILDGEPMKKGLSVISGTEETSKWTTNYRMKRKLAKDKGVVALLIVQTNFDESVEDRMHHIVTPSMKLDVKDKADNKILPRFFINKNVANHILGDDKLIADLKIKIDKKGRPVKTTTKGTLYVKMTREVEQVTSENVLGFIEGTDKKDEIVILTAHYDHIGIDEKGVVFNGADDDGSGTVAIMEIAQAFAQAKADGNGPRRSVLIMPVAGEEKGLLGSDWYSRNPVYPLDKTVADLNIDMIGRLDTAHAGNPNYIYVIGSNMLSTELHTINEKANSTYVNIELDYTYNERDEPNRYYYRSDHYNFAKHNIPVIFYFNGVHEDYHKATDTVDKIDFDKMEKITRLVFHTAWDLANREERIKVDVVEENEKD